MANIIVAQLLYLDAIDPNKVFFPIFLLIFVKKGVFFTKFLIECMHFNSYA